MYSRKEWALVTITTHKRVDSALLGLHVALYKQV